MNTFLLALQSNCFANQQKLLIKQNKALSDFHSQILVSIFGLNILFNVFYKSFQIIYFTSYFLPSICNPL